jgi:putative SOS response-associated peptidase YedK
MSLGPPLIPTIGNGLLLYRARADQPFALSVLIDDLTATQSIFAILTTKAIEAVSYIHERMPVILPLDREKAWLPPTQCDCPMSAPTRARV